MGCACVKSDVVVRNQMIGAKQTEFEGNSRGDFESRERERRELSRLNENVNTGNRNNMRSNSNNNVSSVSSNVNARASQVGGRSSSHGQGRGGNSNNSAHVQNLINRLNVSGSNIPSNILGSMPYLPSAHDPDFNFPEVGDIYVGTGLRKMKGYISTIPIEEIEKKRAEFWGNYLLILTLY
jgi:hypothetical protein